MRLRSMSRDAGVVGVGFDVAPVEFGVGEGGTTWSEGVRVGVEGGAVTTGLEPET